MIIYNITFHIDKEILDKYLIFLKKEYIPAVLKEKILDHPRFCKVLADSDDGSVSYSLQFQVENMNRLNVWWEKCGKVLNQQISERFPEQVLGFSTLLEIENHEE